MIKPRLESSVFVTKEEEKNFLTLSEIFKNLEPANIIAKLKESNGEVELAIERLLAEQSEAEKSKADGPIPTTLPHLHKSRRKERERAKEKLKETPSVTENEVEKLIKLQKSLEQIYEKSFEVLEKKINEQSQEIEMLREMVKTRDDEIHRLKKELEVNDAKKVNETVQFHCRCRDILSPNVAFVKRNIDATLDNTQRHSLSPDNTKDKHSPYDDAVKDFNFKFKTELAFAFLIDLVNNASSREEIDSLLARKALWEAYTLNKLASMLQQMSCQSLGTQSIAASKKPELTTDASGTPPKLVALSPKADENPNTAATSLNSLVECSSLTPTCSSSPLPPSQPPK
jgi:hypothetical protein